MVSRLIPKAAQPVKFISHDGSKGILDDFAVRKNVATKEGTIEHVPTQDNHIVNKKYVDDEIADIDLSAYSLIDGSRDFTSEPNIYEELTAGESLVSGNQCYLKSDGKYWKAKADAEATTKGRIVLCTESISADATGTFLIKGNFTDSSLTAGATYYLSVSTAGAKVSTIPSTSGNQIRVLGQATSTTNFYFNPSQDYGEVA